MITPLYIKQLQARKAYNLNFQSTMEAETKTDGMEK